jgi:hypothetical protein
MTSILDPSFRYTASFNTDLRKTFARFRRRQRLEAAKVLPPPAAARAVVASIVSRSGSRG